MLAPVTVVVSRWTRGEQLQQSGSPVLVEGNWYSHHGSLPGREQFNKLRSWILRIPTIQQRLGETCQMYWLDQRAPSSQHRKPPSVFHGLNVDVKMPTDWHGEHPICSVAECAKECAVLAGHHGAVKCRNLEHLQRQGWLCAPAV